MSKAQAGSIFRAALYLRLSKDDGAGESQSIGTQRSILQAYAAEQGILIYDEYVDDGWSGTNYDRPAFQRMISDIDAGKVNCVLTKDFSRLGRNSARTSDLMDEYFPSRGVRYISVNDGYDSLHLNGGAAMSAAMLITVHELYARDTSNKIRSSFRSKREKGEYIGSYAPYGYKKDIEHGNKNRLVIDHNVAHIVQEVFALAAEGQSPKRIADILNEKGVATPLKYRESGNPFFDVQNSPDAPRWTASGICKMLANRVYLGITEQGKSSKISFKSKQVQSIPREEWVRVANTHEPLVSEELFRQVRARSVARRSLPTKGFENIFSGIAKCADCGRNMTPSPSRKKGATYNLCCGSYKSKGASSCSNHFIDYDCLYAVVLSELQGLLCLNEEDKKSLLHDLQQADTIAGDPKDDISKAITKWEARIKEIGALSKRLYEDFLYGGLSEELYDAMRSSYEQELADLKCSVAKQQALLIPETEKAQSYESFFELLDEMTEIKSLDKELLHRFIDRIEVEQGYYAKDIDGKRSKFQKLRIYYRFIGCIDA